MKKKTLLWVIGSIISILVTIILTGFIYQSLSNNDRLLDDKIASWIVATIFGIGFSTVAFILPLLLGMGIFIKKGKLLGFMKTDTTDSRKQYLKSAIVSGIVIVTAMFLFVIPASIVGEMKQGIAFNQACITILLQACGIYLWYIGIIASGWGIMYLFTNNKDFQEIAY
jgi:uncharacterized BrkB/YihY/UPF0761 family membrane protein